MDGCHVEFGSNSVLFMACCHVEVGSNSVLFMACCHVEVGSNSVPSSCPFVPLTFNSIIPRLDLRMRVAGAGRVSR
ncbi:hypothetical protein RRG08_039319 [Elysia crispata]|uniref:Uncharacterized protein n=1 Tax=Elysia crispata TaxID=231223 RepID=A0AAE1D3L7_9GAST|nr:hypothetical protein RRG08_039319 [Elysia crispata]